MLQCTCWKHTQIGYLGDCGTYCRAAAEVNSVLFPGDSSWISVFNLAAGCCLGSFCYTETRKQINIDVVLLQKWTVAHGYIYVGSPVARLRWLLWMVRPSAQYAPSTLSMLLFFSGLSFLLYDGSSILLGGSWPRMAHASSLMTYFMAH